jgi:predicted PolB exonuclease-like 3'-5' exonuclease
MRNQYKLLSEKYKLVNESDKEDIMAGLGELEYQQKKKETDRLLMEEFIEKVKYVESAIVELEDLYNSKECQKLYYELKKAPAEETEDELENHYFETYSYLKQNLLDTIRHSFRNIS